MIENRELYKGAAADYAKYRPSYPKVFFEKVADHYKLTGKGRLLDSGCGTGRLTLPLSRYFEFAIGLDSEKEMLEVAKEEAEKGGIKNIEWVWGKAENFETEKSFRLVKLPRLKAWASSGIALKKRNNHCDAFTPAFKAGASGVGVSVTFGSCLHWMEQEKVLEKAYRILEKDGGLVIVSDYVSLWKEGETEK